jgi:hypothetical protein
MGWTKTLERVLRGTSDANIDSSDLCQMLNASGLRDEFGATTPSLAARASRRS